MDWPFLGKISWNHYNTSHLNIHAFISKTLNSTLSEGQSLITHSSPKTVDSHRAKFLCFLYIKLAEFAFNIFVSATLETDDNNKISKCLQQNSRLKTKPLVLPTLNKAHPYFNVTSHHILKYQTLFSLQIPK